MNKRDKELSQCQRRKRNQIQNLGVTKYIESVTIVSNYRVLKAIQEERRRIEDWVKNNYILAFNDTKLINYKKFLSFLKERRKR